MTHSQVLDNDIALLVSPQPNAMAKGFERLIDDANFAKRIGLNAKERVKHEFNYKAFQRKLSDFYRDIESDLVKQRSNSERRI
jgi:glycosyltransferase involved in cell wall biosynthesis